MSCELEIATVLRERRLRQTPQRARILATLRHAAAQLTASEVHSRLVTTSDVAPPISLSTVYRTLEGLRDAGVVAAHESSAGGATFEWAADASTHHHLRCVRCGATSETELPRLASLEAEIRAQTGFHASIRHLAITGVCASCFEAEPGTVGAS